MKADFQYDELFPRLLISAYLCATLAIAFLLYDQYQQGHYSLVLTNALAIPAFLFSAIFIYVNRHLRQFIRINFALSILLASLALYQLSIHPTIVVHYFYALPLFNFFALPLFMATVINLVVGLLVFLLLWLQQDIMVALRIGANYSLLLGSAWCFAYLTLLKGWSLKRLALIDHYSGAYNYRHFTYAFQREIARSHSAGKEVSLIALLIDDYAMLIDIYGHEVLSKLLPSMVDTTQQLVRTEDEIYRLGPDLFVLLLPNCAEEHAHMLMERIKKGLAEQNWEPINQLSLSAAALGVQVGEDSREAEKRLKAKLKKQRLTILQMSAFNE